MKTSKIYFIVFFLLTSCLTKKDAYTDKEESVRLNQIVLIFENFPEDYSIYLNDTKGKAYTPARPELRYYDENLIQRILKPKSETADTVIIICNQNTIEFQHSVKGVDNFEYLFQKGDTVIFSYSKKIPNAKIINRTVSDFEINYDLRYREIICNSDYPAFTKVLVPWTFITYNSNFIGKEGERLGILGEIDRVKVKANVSFIKELELEKAFLDSLFTVNLITRQAFDWLNQKRDLKGNIIKAHNDDLARNQIGSIIPKDLDSLLKYHSYRDLIANINSAFYERKVKRILTSNSNLPDYKLVYDSILRSDLFSKKTKEILLFETSKSLIINSSATEISKHLTRLKSDIVDTTYLSYLMNTYKIKNPISKELELIDLNGNKLTLSKFIEQNKGKVIYVDIWASWCRPCIEEFPQSRILIEKLKTRDIQFIYLSIDDENIKWKNASRKHRLPDKYSFMVDNRKTSKFLEELDFNTIPRYLVFNRAGKLEYKNAPRLSDQRTFILLEELLTK